MMRLLRLSERWPKFLLDDSNVRWRDADAKVYQREIQRGFMNHQEGIHPMILLASALDPRFKNLPGIDFNSQDEIWEEIVDMMVDENLAREVYPEWVAQMTEAEAEEPVQQNAAHVPEENFFMAEVNAANAMQAAGGVPTRTRLWRAAKDELKRYRDADALKVHIMVDEKMHFNDPLTWWKEHQKMFPLLRVLAC
jgi:hypothetical protein